MSNTELDCLKNELCSESLANLSDKQQSTIYEKILQNKLSCDTIAAIIKSSPIVASGFFDIAKNISKAALESNNVSKKALETLKATLESLSVPLNTLAKNCKTHKERIHIATIIKEISFKISEATTEIQRENSRAPQNFLTTLRDLLPPILITALLAGCGGYAVGSHSKNDNSTPQS